MYRHIAMVLWGCMIAAMLNASLQAAETQFTIKRQSDAVVIRDGDGPIMLQYQLTKPADSLLSVESACYFHPLSTPRGFMLTDVAPADHRHHRGLFQGWVEMHGTKDADFWGWGEHAPTQNRVIVNLETQAPVARGSLATFRCRNAWKAGDETILVEYMIALLRRIDGANVLDLDYTLIPESDLTLSQWAFGGFCLRARQDIPAVIRNASGQVDLPAPVHTQPDSDWPDAPWYALDMTLADGSKAGVAVMNHPQNPKTLWHNHAGLRMLNPCITAPGEVILAAQKRFPLRYRVVAYDGEFSAENLQKLYGQWSGR